MRVLPLYALLCMFLNIGLVHSQDNTNTNGIKEIDNANKTIENANSSIKSTNQSVKNTVDSSKETIATIGSLFGSKKNKENKKSEDIVLITVQQVSYDTEQLNSLYSRITKSKGVKKPIKKFSKGTALITVNYKETADMLWQSIPKQERKFFKMVEISDSNIVVQFYEDN
ncbi:hypothetical protein [uncultured Maribacter sp.]|uniref:hypothetical protein n=1 Tax=uncultured Maribacter sp. TaxID=431308 RepID=UPI00261C20AD|nr:hypothetical protein [uncultured Maribacter sp.]